MIYSEWCPDTGGYKYFEAPGTQNINDDLPTPDLPPATKIGVPSIEAGRPFPSGAEEVGEGDVAVGVVAPVDKSRRVRRMRSLGEVAAAGGDWRCWLGGAAFGAFALWLGASIWYERRGR